jgi:hypothetical protein
MTYRERRTILIFWTVVALLILSAFAAEAQLKNQVCISSITVDSTGTTSFVPKECS